MRPKHAKYVCWPNCPAGVGEIIEKNFSVYSAGGIERSFKKWISPVAQWDLAEN